MMPTFAGMKIIKSPFATEHDGYNWAPSKHRSKRVTKKLMKRYHGVYEKRKPSCYKFGDSLVMHPSLVAELWKAAYSYDYSKLEQRVLSWMQDPPDLVPSLVYKEDATPTGRMSQPPIFNYVIPPAYSRPVVFDFTS